MKRTKFPLILSPDIKMVVAFYVDLSANCKVCVDTCRKLPLTLSEATEVY